MEELKDLEKCTMKNVHKRRNLSTIRFSPFFKLVFILKKDGEGEEMGKNHI